MAAWRGGVWALFAAVAAIAITVGWTIRWRPGRLRRRGPSPLGLRDALELLRQAYGATGAWGVGTVDGPLEVLGAPSATEEQRGRAAALVQLAAMDGRVHEVRDADATYVAVGDFPYGAGLALDGKGHSETLTESIAGALRRYVAGMRVADEQHIPRARVVAGHVSHVVAGAQSLGGIARGAVEVGAQLTGRPVALVVGSDEPRIEAVSRNADRRLTGTVLVADSPVARAIASGIPVATRGHEDVFGPGVPDRRKGDRTGTAYPLLDGAVVVGALVLLGPPPEADAPIHDDLNSLLADIGPRIAAARAVHEAESRAVVDPLTGLRNRRELERVLGSAAGRASEHDPMTLIYVDLDHFKKLNDTLGHPAGDAALKHVARLLEAAVRSRDLVARIGGEEFAVWLPGTGLSAGLEVAERIRRSIADKPVKWEGVAYPLTTSCGIASCPELVGDVTNLPAAADAALYRAKELGRNRVEKAGAAR